MNKRVESPQSVNGSCIAFCGDRCIASGGLLHVAQEAKKILDQHGESAIVILDATTSEPIEVDFRGTPDKVAARIGSASAAAANERPPAPGRPRLGVVSREVTLLPRHWEWLSEQPGGASVTLRKLVEEARRSTAGEAALRRSREACYRFMTILAGDEPGYEEALRALFAGDQEQFGVCTQEFPPDVREHARRLAAAGFLDGLGR